jgi:hypothetical protein
VKTKADAAGDKLCAAIAAWVKELGGAPVEVGGLRIRNKGRGKWTLSADVTGFRPAEKHELRSASTRAEGK